MTQTPLQRRLIRLAKEMNKKALRFGVRGRVTAEELGRIIFESDGACAYCSIDLPDMEGTFDHVLSYAQGGDNLPHNIVRACSTCNRTKSHSKTPEDLAAYAALRVTCICGVEFRPRWADWKRGYGRTHSRACAGRLGGRRSA